MYRPTSFALLPILLAAVMTIGCDDDPAPGPTPPPPTEITETFRGQLTVNGAVTTPFFVQTAGDITARLSSLSVPDAVVGLSLGTWNGQTCQLIITNDSATVTGTQQFPVTGRATDAGAFCVRIYDVGRLSGPVDFEIIVTHF